ncbi:asparagine synthase-related protein [Thermomonospora umbrina]|uniref:asparagine synthase (glutamine-hydrolyzing) n=1 Tax=Thermomonospora umbrina TaxID=111806 RepID=A0A3D9SSG2_9ACTN|nr:asparagine synthase-related protein [Thermomonospora umbrina]REE96913.1 asparagine synthase (glutamine-hydrolysing) [Thermomonospora umbrina]
MDRSLDFVIVPDNVAGEALTRSLRARPDVRTLRYASGRPWIIGRWKSGQVIRGEAGERRIAVLGHAATDSERLTRLAGECRTIRDLDRVSGTLPGGYHLVATIGDTVRVQGSLSSARQVFYGAVQGITVAADRPDTLALLAGKGIREDLVAGRLLAPLPPWPIIEQSLWHGIEALPAGCYLELSASGAGRPVCWWQPPEPHVPLEKGAERVRAALSDAVRSRTHGKATISADLSGGMDSTSVCFLASGSVGRLITVHRTPHDKGDEDSAWAARAASAIPGSDHLVIGTDEIPGWFAGLLEPDPDVEAPVLGVHLRGALAHLARRLSASGSELHLTGDGGDELFLPNPLYLHELVRRRPFTALRVLRADRALTRWRLRPTLRALRDDQPFHTWLSDVAETVDAPLRGVRGVPFQGWGISYRLPAWATPEAAESVRGLLRGLATSGTEPLSPIRGQHSVLQDIRVCGDVMRRAGRLTARHGLPYDSPFVDDQVVEAALSVDFTRTAMPDRYKPALVEAMRGIVPDSSLSRSTKSEYSADAYSGLRRHREELLELCDDMRLAHLGLVDAEALRATLLSLPPSSLHLLPLLSTLACEVWLRSLTVAHREQAPA